MSPIKKYHALIAQKLIDEFSKRNIEGFYCETKEDALKKAIELMPEKSVVSCGGSATLNEIGFREAIKSKEYTFLDPKAVQGLQEIERVAHEAFNADYYLMSANAISLSGELVNADGIGNRIGALAYGPKHVIIVAGLNKVEPNLHAAIDRVKTKANYLGLIAYKDFNSLDELAESGGEIISHLTITSRSVIKGRIKIILVNEVLGF